MIYVVKSLSLNGGGNKIFRSGDEVTERDFKPGRFHTLISAGHIVIKQDAQIVEPTPTDKTQFTVAISTAVWRRYDVFAMFAEGIKELQHEFPNIKFITIVAGSEGQKSKAAAELFGFQYIEIPNDPLAAKFNITTALAKKHNPDYVLCLGSDDIIHPSLMRLYVSAMQRGYDFIGIEDMYFWDTVSGKCLYWGGYRDARRKGHTAGAGRLISSRLMSAWGWAPWEIRHSKVLDNSMQGKLSRTPHSRLSINIRAAGAFALDIKSETNMTPFERWDNSEFIDPEIIQDQFQYLPICAVSQQS